MASRAARAASRAGGRAVLLVPPGSPDTRKAWNQEKAGRVSGRLLNLSGSTGFFEALLEVGSKKIKERVGAMVLALEPEPSEVLPAELAELPQELLSTIDQKDFSGDGRVGMLGGFWDRPGPARFGRFLKAAAAVLESGGRAFLFFPQALVAGEGLEERFRELRREGAVVTRLEVPPLMKPQGSGIRLGFFDPLALLPVAMTVDRLVWDQPLALPAEVVRLAGLMGLATGPEGWPRPDNVLFPAPLTSRAGVFALGGPSRPGEPNPEQELEILADLLKAVVGLGKEPFPAVRLSSQRGFCAECLTCLRICPVKAVIWQGGPVVLEAACLGCGQCAASCPRSIIRPLGEAEEELAACLTATTPNPLVLACDRIRLEDLTGPADLVRLPCLGRVSEEMLLKLIAAGRRRVVVAGCHPGNCRSLTGTEQARRAAARVGAFLEAAGLDPGLVRFVSLAPHQVGRLEAALEGS